MLAEAIAVKLCDVPEIVARLSTVGGAPAVFAYDIRPPDASLAFISIRGLGGLPAGTFACKGHEAQAQVSLYGPRELSNRELARTADLVCRTLDRAVDLADPEGEREIVNVRADSPAQIEDPDGFPGFRIAVQARVIERNGG